MTRAAVLDEPRAPLRVAEVSVDRPGPGEVLVGVVASGVCHSDHHAWQRDLPFRYPCILGHEAAGRVLAVGDGVGNVGVDDHVVLCVVPQCGRCAPCRRGQPTLCVEARSTMGATLPGGVTRTSLADGRAVGQMAGLGAWSEEAVVSADSVVRIDPDVPFTAAALLGCGVVTGYGAVANVAEIQPGATVAVLGCGGLGLSAVQTARILGAERIVAIDLAPAKLALAEELGATETVLGGRDVVEEVLERTGGEGVDAAFDFVVNGATARQVIKITRRGGTTVLTGFGEEDLAVSATDLIRAGRTLKGNLMGMGTFADDFSRLVGWYRSGALQLERLVSRRYSLDDVGLALAALDDDDVARSVIDISAP